MPLDKRLYMTFPIDIHRHPKLQRLSAEVKWAFVEMNGEARIAGNDGRFTAEEAEYLWSPEILHQLVRSHPSRPLVMRDGTDYVIRDYAEHQQTVSAIEELTAKRSAAGRQGAAVTNGKRSASAAASADYSPASAEQTPAKGRQSSAESESESEIELSDINHLTQSGHVSNARDGNVDGDFVERLKAKALIDADALGIKSLVEVRDWIEKSIGHTVNLGETVQLAADILARAKGDVREPDRYVIGVCRKSPARVAEYADVLDLGVAS